MPQSVITYDKDLPEVPGRCAWQPPATYLVKDESAASGWRVEASGRRPSTLLLIDKLRKAVDGWRNQGYPGASYPSGCSNTGSRRTTKSQDSRYRSAITSASAKRSKR